MVKDMKMNKIRKKKQISIRVLQILENIQKFMTMLIYIFNKRKKWRKINKQTNNNLKLKKLSPLNQIYQTILFIIVIKNNNKIS